MDHMGNRVSRAPSLTTQVHNAMRSNIMSGDLGSGERLVVDRLAKRFNVSPTPVREALARLIQDGIVEEVAPGRLHIVPVTRNYVLDTYWVRSVLEGLAAELATNRMSSEDARRMKHLVDEGAIAIDDLDIDVYEERNQEFHSLLVTRSDNHVLSREIESLQLHVVYIRQYFLEYVSSTTDRLRKANAEHMEVAGAIADQNAHEARRLMERHIRNSGIRMGELVQRKEGGGDQM